MAANATTSPLASIKFGAANIPPQLEFVVDYVSNVSTWAILATVLATLVVYDQCRDPVCANFQSNGLGVADTL